MKIIYIYFKKTPLQSDFFQFFLYICDFFIVWRQLFKQSSLQYYLKMLSPTQIVILLMISLFTSDCSTVKKIVNFPGAQIIESTKQNDIISLQWLDAISTVSFNLSLYSTSQTLADLQNTSKAGNMTQSAKSTTSITYVVDQIPSFNLIKVYLNATTPRRFKLTHTQSSLNTTYVIYSVFSPPANKVILIPFIVKNSKACQYSFERGSYVSSFNDTITVQLFKPNSALLTGAPTFSFTLGPLTSALTPSLLGAGTWYARFTSSLKSKANLTSGIAAETLTIKLSTYGCSNCNNKCYNNSYVDGAASNYFVVDECYCPAGYIYNSAINMCYRNCSWVDGVLPTKLFNLQYNRCECSNSIQAYSYTTSLCTTNCSVLKNALKTQTRTVADNCTCNSNYTWNSIEKVCMITCSRFANTINNTKRFNSQSCFCKPKFVWDFRNRKCSLNCSSIPFTTCSSIYYLEPGTQCVCILGYLWNELNQANQCVRDCSTDPYATTFNPANISQCVCTDEFIWNPTLDKCIRNCSIDPNANGPDPTNSTKCSCLVNFIWYQSANRCSIDCLLDPYAISYNIQDLSTCICVTEFAWSSQLIQCRRDCALIPYSNGLSTSDISICLCQDPLSWMPDINRCSRNCSVDPYYLSYNVDDFATCLCISEFEWSLNLFRCVRSCQIIAFSTSLQIDDVSACSCIPQFIWTFEVSRCVRDCSLDSNANTYNQSDYSACICKDQYTWSTSINKCVRNCSSDPNAIDFDPMDVNTCVCNSQYQWEPASNICVRNCSNDTYAVSFDTSNISACTCLQSFLWNPEFSQCVKNCALDPNAISFLPNDVSACTCQPSLVWDTTNELCGRDCTSDINAVSFDSSNVYICTCKVQYQWDTSMNSCLRDCSNDTNAVSYDYLNISACTCKSDFVWSGVDGKCVRQCATDPYAVFFNSQNVSTCLCITNFRWQDSPSRCVRDCSSDAMAISFEADDVSRCSCNENFVWNLQTFSCIRRCCVDPNAESLNFTDFTACNCKIGFGWSYQTNKCTKNCSLENIEACVVDCRVKESFLQNKQFCQNSCNAWEIWDGYICVPICNRNQIALLNFDQAVDVAWECIHSTASINKGVSDKCSAKSYYEQVECQFTCPWPYNYPIYSVQYKQANNSYKYFANYSNSTQANTSIYENCRVLHNFQQQNHGRSLMLIEVFSFSGGEYRTVLYENVVVCPRGYYLQAAWNNVYNQLTCYQFSVDLDKCRPWQVLDSRNSQQVCVDLCKQNQIAKYIQNYYGLACIPITSVARSASASPLDAGQSSQSTKQNLNVGVIIVCSIMGTLMVVVIFTLLVFKKFNLRIQNYQIQAESDNQSIKQIQKQRKSNKNQSSKQLRAQIQVA